MFKYVPRTFVLLQFTIYKNKAYLKIRLYYVYIYITYYTMYILHTYFLFCLYLNYMYNNQQIDNYMNIFIVSI